MRTLYLPARDERHRVAVLALYRALLRSAKKVPLPESITRQVPKAVKLSGGPIADVVRRRFDGNRPCTSPRLLYAAMAAGYRFLTLFEKASSKRSPENAEVCEHIRSGLVTAQQDRRRSRVGLAAKKLRDPLRKKPSEPIIVNVAPPGTAPFFRPNILPRRSVPPPPTGDGADGESPSRPVRPPRVPHVSTTACGQPFLRLVKPQPASMSMALKREDLRWQRRAFESVRLRDVVASNADCEDDWEQLMASQLAQEPSARNRAALADLRADIDEPTASHAWPIRLALLWHEFRFEHTRRLWAERGRAFAEVVEAQRVVSEAWPNDPPEGGIPQEIRDLIGHPQVEQAAWAADGQFSSPSGANGSPPSRTSARMNRDPSFPLHTKCESLGLPSPWSPLPGEARPPLDPYMAASWAALTGSAEETLAPKMRADDVRWSTEQTNTDKWIVARHMSRETVAHLTHGDGVVGSSVSV